MFTLSLILIAACATGLFADTTDPPVDTWLFGARSAALSGAVLVSGNGAHALFHNPAGIAGRMKPQAGAGMLKLALDRTVSWAGVVIPRGRWCAALSWGEAAVSDIPMRSEDGSLSGYESWRRDRIGVAYARMLNLLTFVGADAHYVGTHMPGNSGRGFGLDVGAVRLVLPPLLSLALGVHDLVSVIQYEKSDRREIAGPLVTGGIVLGLVEGKLRFEFDVSKRLGQQEWKSAAGLEIKVHDSLKLRAGFGSAGISAGLAISAGPVEVAYSGIPDPLGNSGQGVEAIWTKHDE